MRYIDPARLIIPQTWQKEAIKALTDLFALTPEERKAYIDQNSKIWKRLKEHLHDLNHGKCWYCESSVSDTAPGDVDHFRPKKAVKECPSHPGYWWLAFDASNYRYSCELCNRPNHDPASPNEDSKGKGDHFPLRDESKRCFVPDNRRALLQEEPLLLDPNNATDPPLLTFAEDGQATPRYEEKANPRKYARAKSSIDIYHLNRSRLVNRRQFEICQKIEQLVAQGDDCILFLATDEDNPVARTNLEATARTLSRMISPAAEYSSSARAILTLHADLEHEWISDLLLTS